MYAVSALGIDNIIVVPYECKSIILSLCICSYICDKYCPLGLKGFFCKVCKRTMQMRYFLGAATTKTCMILATINTSTVDAQKIRTQVSLTMDSHSRGTNAIILLTFNFRASTLFEILLHFHFK